MPRLKIDGRDVEVPPGTTLLEAAQHGLVAVIPMTPFRRHTIDLAKCTRCDTCHQVCPEKAVEVK